MSQTIDWMQIITNQGFAIAAYLLIYLDLRKKIEDLIQKVDALKAK